MRNAYVKLIKLLLNDKDYKYRSPPKLLFLLSNPYSPTCYPRIACEVNCLELNLRDFPNPTLTTSIKENTALKAPSLKA